MSNIGSSKIAEMYVGSTKIAQAYVGSTLVFQLPAQGYDYYIIHLIWSSTNNFNMAGLHLDGLQPPTSEVTLQYYYNDSWQTASLSDTETAIQWDYNDNGKAFYCDGINIIFPCDNIPSTIQVKTGRWYGGGDQEVTMHVAGIKDGAETDLGYTKQFNDRDLIYTVNI